MRRMQEAVAPRLSPRSRSALVAVGGCLLAAAVTVAAISQPRLFAVGVVGLVLAVTVYTRPWIAIALVLCFSGFGLPLTLVGLDGSLLSTGGFAVALIGAACVVLKSLPHPPKATALLLVGLIFVCLIGLVVGHASLPLQQSVQGIRIFAVPILCAIIASAMRVTDMRRLMRVGTVIVVLSLIAAAIESALGVDRLVGAGLEYGTSVRSYSDSLRAPGLFTTNYSLGAFAGVMGALAFVWWPALEAGKRAATWRLVAIVGSAGCLVLSIYRTGIVVLLLSVAIWLVTDRAANRVFARVAAVIGAVGFVAYLLASGLLSTKSLGQRSVIWDQLLSQYPPQVFGYGLGFSGAASGSRFADRKIVVDNYVLNLGTQLGVIGALFLLALLVVAIRAVIRSIADRRFTSGAVLLAVLVGFLFVDYWEYTPAMGLCLAAFVFAGRIPPQRAALSDSATDTLSDRMPGPRVLR